MTTIQDASVTNGPEEWNLFRRLGEDSDLLLRVFMFRGARHWRDMVVFEFWPISVDFSQYVIHAKKRPEIRLFR